MRAPYRYILPSVLLSAALAGAALSGAASAKDKVQDKKERESKAPAATSIGEARSCIPLRNIRRTNVHDDYTIDFEMRGGRIYRSDLPRRCPGLGFEQAISYSTSINQLCNSDVVTVLNRSGIGLQPRGACGLGRFQEVELIKDDKDAE
jgi:hypothetical protein